MTTDQSWAVRGLTSQNWAVMQSLIAIIEDRRLTASRCRDLVRQLEYMAEQVKQLTPTDLRTADKKPLDATPNR